MQIHLRTLIQQIKPRRALFTTFTFSINWFENFLFPELRKSGCEQIDVLVDARAARRSTEDISALSVGTDYRVIPVPMKGATFFHPKVAYFEGETHDVLFVSSANLTLSGHGKNLEVHDAIGSDVEPGVFVEFSGFLESLLARHTFQPENLQVLHAYRERAAKWLDAAAAVPDAERRVWLIHTLDEPALEQFAALAGNSGGRRLLTVLSPYHAPDGAPVRKLAADVRASQIRIGLSAGGGSSEALVARFQAPPDDFTYVVPVTEEENRFAHAKIFELSARDGETYLMAGSVNATHQSLDSTKNVEVSLVRRLPATPFSWADATPSRWEANKVDPDNLSETWASLEATWTVENRIVGRVVPVRGPQSVRAELWAGANLIAPLGEVTLAVDGTFSVSVSEVPNTDQGLRLVLTSDTVQAVGWLNLEVALATNSREHKVFRLTQQLVAGDMAASEFDRMLAWLDGIGPPVPEAAPQPKQKASEGHKDETSPLPPVTVADWLNSITPYRDEQVRQGIVEQHISALERYLNGDDLFQLESSSSDETENFGVKIFMNEREESAAANPTPKPGSPAKQTTKRDRKAERERNRRQFVARLPRRLALGARDFFVPGLVESAGNIVRAEALRFQSTQSDTSEARTESPYSLSGWLDEYSYFDYDDAGRERLLSFFCASACYAAHLLQDENLGMMKEAIFRLATAELTVDEVRARALTGFASPAFTRFASTGLALMAESASALVTSQTPDQQLLALVLGALRESGDATGISLSNKVLFDMLYRRRNSRFAFGLAVGARSEKPQCPSCYEVLNIDTMRSKRVIVCSCRLPVFYGLTRDELRREGLGGRFKG